MAARMLVDQGRTYVPGHYTRLTHNGSLIMSDTPDERWDHYRFVREARDAVLISGLGLGMCLTGVLRKPEVTDVTVLEISQDLIDLVGPHFDDPRLSIVCTNALDWKPPKGKTYGAVWHDIWPNMSQDNLPQMGLLNRRYARKAAWKGCWRQDVIVAARERDRRACGYGW